MKEAPMRGFLSKLKVRFLGLKRWQQIVVVVGVLLFMFAPVGASQESDNETGAVPTPVASGKPTPTPSSTPVATPSSTPAPTASTPATSANRCVVVSQKKLNRIADLLTVSGGGSLANGHAVKSNDFESLWFIAATINGPKMGSKTIGIWATNTLEAVTGGIFSVDSFAEEFSDWVVGSTTDANITQYDDGAQEAAQCAGKP
jgi:hypothetical protein